MTLALLRRVAAVFAVALGLTVVMAGQASAAPAQNPVPAPIVFQFGIPASAFSTPTGFPTGNVYCTDKFHKPKCLASLTGQVGYLGCGKSGGGDVDTVIQNPNRSRAPRDIAVFFNGSEFFGDRDWALPGKNVVQYRGLPDGSYNLLVGWDDQGLIFYGLRFTVACGPTTGGAARA